MEHANFLRGEATKEKPEEGCLLTALIVLEPTSESDCEMDFLGYFAYPVDAEGRYSTPGRPEIPPEPWAPTQADIDAVVAWLLSVNARLKPF